MLPASASLLAAVKSGEGVNITYTTTPRLGAYFGFDHLGRYSEMGSPLNPTLVRLYIAHAPCIGGFSSMYS
eukprot:m.266817 g.266817  ORF g.266817 m.266817 type:complete len:71 (-) comp17630_c0_seq35:52-264(-)